MSHSVAVSRQIREYSADNRKNLLAKYMRDSLIGNMPVAKAEMLARSNPEFLKENENSMSGFLEAEKVLSRWQAEMCRYDGLRSLLSYSKQVFESLQG